MSILRLLTNCFGARLDETFCLIMEYGRRPLEDYRKDYVRVIRQLKKNIDYDWRSTVIHHKSVIGGWLRIPAGRHLTTGRSFITGVSFELPVRMLSQNDLLFL